MVTYNFICGGVMMHFQSGPQYHSGWPSLNKLKITHHTDESNLYFSRVNVGGWACRVRDWLGSDRHVRHCPFPEYQVLRVNNVINQNQSVYLRITSCNLNQQPGTTKHPILTYTSTGELSSVTTGGCNANDNVVCNWPVMSHDDNEVTYSARTIGSH